MTSWAGVFGPPPLLVVEDIMLVTGRLPQSQRTKNLRQFAKAAQKLAIVAFLVMVPLVFIQFHEWQSTCVMSGGELTNSTSCFYPGHTTFTGEYVAPTTKHYNLLVQP